MKVYRFYAVALLIVVGAIVLGAMTRPATPAPPQITVTPSFPLLITCARAKEYISGEICIETEPGALLSLQVTYCSGEKAQSESLKQVQQANNQGKFVWVWIPQTACAGEAVASVTAQWHGLRVEKSVRFQVE